MELIFIKTTTVGSFSKPFKIDLITLGTAKNKEAFFDFNGSQTGTEQVKALEVPKKQETRSTGG